MKINVNIEIIQKSRRQNTKNIFVLRSRDIGHFKNRNVNDKKKKNLRTTTVVSSQRNHCYFKSGSIYLKIERAISIKSQRYCKCINQSKKSI